MNKGVFLEAAIAMIITIPRMVCKMLARILPERHVDPILGDGMPVLEIPLHRTIDPDSQLQAIAIGQDVILVCRFDCFQLAIR